MEKRLQIKDLRIVGALPEDVPGIVKIVATTFPHDFEYEGKFDPHLCSLFFKRAIDDPNEIVIVCKRNQEVIGFVYYINKPPSNGTVLLDMVGVRKDLQGQGIGTYLLGKADKTVVHYIRDVCNIENLATINLSTGFDNPAGQNLYTKAGYKLRGTMVGFLGNGNVELVFIKDVARVPYRQELWTPNKKTMRNQQ